MELNFIPNPKIVRNLITTTKQSSWLGLYVTPDIKLQVFVVIEAPDDYDDSFPDRYPRLGCQNKKQTPKKQKQTNTKPDSTGLIDFSW